MGNKKRNVAAPSSKAAPADGDGGAAYESVISSVQVEQNLGSSSSLEQRKQQSKAVIEASVAESDASSSSRVKLECKRALTALRRGNHTKALRIMKETCAKHENSVHSALIHRVQGTVSAKVFAIIDDPIAKQRHLKNAIESAKKAVSLSPNSVEFALFYANLLYDGKEYEEVLQECDRALAIQNPVDPAKESLQDESQQSIATGEARIEHVQKELRSLIQKANLASISSWMKFRVISTKGPAEDPMEPTSLQARRPNEIKKATKTPEERRKEIEVRVAAARLLQHKSETPQSQNDDGKALDSSSGSVHRVGERRRFATTRKRALSAERRARVRSYWNNICLDTKKDLLRIVISELKSHFSSLKDSSANEVLSEAISFAECNRTWKLWMCCRCNEKFADFESQMQHVLREHMGNLFPQMQPLLPQTVDSEWVEMLLNCSWKPVDVDAAVKLLDEQLSPQFPELLDESYPRNCTKEFDCLADKYCSEDAWDLPLQKGKFCDTCNGDNVQGKTYQKVSDIRHRECDGNLIGKACVLPNLWPLSDDTERAKLLEKIHLNFQLLIGHKCLAASHVHKIMRDAVNELQGLASISRLLNYGIDQIPVCICFLGAGELKKVLKYLQELSNSCGLGRYSEKSSSFDYSGAGTNGTEIVEEIVLSEDASYLLFDEHFLASSLASTCHSIDTDDAFGPTSTSVGYKSSVLLDADAFLSWIFAGPTAEEQLASWTHLREEKEHQGREILQTLEKELYQLQGIYEKKCNHLSYEDARQAVESLYLEEGKKREHVREVVCQSYESVTVLRKRREELIQSDNDIMSRRNKFELDAISNVLRDDNDIMSMRNKFELDAISNVLREAEALNVSQFGSEETYNGVTNHLRNLESSEGDASGTKKYLHQLDSCIEVAIQRQKEQIASELGKIDAIMMQYLTELQQMEAKLEQLSALDYRSILVPLTKSFILAHLEDLAKKEATEKSDAAREAFLAELALDSKKGIAGRSYSLTHPHEKMKDKKKNKENRKTKDLKATGNNERMPCYETADGSSSPVASNVDDAGSKIVESVSVDTLKQQEEEHRRRIELEAEERKLEETLEYQRRIEDEAKQKHLAEQKKTTGTIPHKHSNSDQNIHEQLKDYKQGPLIQKNGSPKVLESVPVNTDRAAEGIGNMHDHHQTKCEQGLPDGEEIHENGASYSDRRMGRKGRRQKSSTKLLDAKYQALSSEKQNIEVAETIVKDSPDGDSYNPSLGDNGMKTLRQLQAEEDEEKFQADVKQAMRQSLDTFHLHQKLPLLTSSSQRMPSHVDDLDASINEVMWQPVDGADICGTGLKNEIGEYNCFLNVIIQSLWHLRRFRDEFLGLSTSAHVHVGDPCVTCALHDIFTALSMASTDMRREAVAPTSLRVALSNLYPDSNFFQESQMNDASEVLGVIFDCLHRSFTSGLDVSVENNCTSSWDCNNTACIAHSLFGMDIFERMDCYNCGLESRHLKYTSFFHNINASALRTTKEICAECSFDELLNLVEVNHQLACDLEAGGCGKLNHIHHILSTPPHVFTTVLGWQNTCESAEDITATLAALATEVDIGVLYRGLDPQNKRCLVSVVCYYGQHYHCFAYSHDHEQWVMYDDKTVKVIGSWGDVLTICKRGRLQPQVLFFEAVN
ncbi:uncharacterized protein LOC127790750 isoform X4 [Diospyros lotus]|uniref:uncharacterized protein LOC127790750 isoform X3 n=1 Tax=Diospyros lotus TaxID=55363 RepID=UPI00225767CE|nr:uncharacterized protein LOC127790750 isoform X3 [Diospyros lotus]XP_052176365.1 uncharacterized protein LOC127790750 isoform X4 [Diospyros lotus]